MDSIRERSWPAVILTPITVSGDKIIVADTHGLHPKQQVVITAPGQESLNLEVKRIIDKTSFQVGPSAKFGNDHASIRRGGTIREITLVPVAYTGGTLVALEQGRTSISSEAIFSAVYAEEPTVALRSALVDYWGQYFDKDNPLPTLPQNGAVSEIWDDLQMDYDPITQDMIQARYYLDGNLVRTLDMSYDMYSNLIRVEKS